MVQQSPVHTASSPHESRTEAERVSQDTRSRNIAIFWLLGGVAALFYGVAVVRLGDALKQGHTIDRFAPSSTAPLSSTAAGA